MRAWLNGELLADPTGPAIPLSDHGFTVGDGVFEAIKVVDSQPFALTRHIQRLAGCADALGLPRLDEDAVREGVTAVLDGEPLSLGRLRVTYTGGDAPMGSGRGTARPTLAVVAAPLTPYPPTASIATVPWPRNERGALAGLKTTSYAENVVALSHAATLGVDEAIFANTLGNLCEGTGTNVFYVVDGELRTPTLASGCLAGVTRALLLDWTGAREIDEPVSVLARASEIFLASTTRDVQGVHLCNGRTLAAPGPVTAEAARTFAGRAASDLDP